MVILFQNQEIHCLLKWVGFNRSDPGDKVPVLAWSVTLELFKHLKGVLSVVRVSSANLQQQDR